MPGPQDRGPLEVSDDSAMRTPFSWAMGVVTCALVVSTIVVASPAQDTAAQQTPAQAPVDAATGLFERMCSECHELKRIVSFPRTRVDWENQITQMIDKGASGTGKEFETVFDYLVRTYGKLYINTAPADEIVEVLSLSPKEADAIVAFRKAKGPFLDFEALRKVSEIDVKKLEERRAAILF